MGLYWGVQVGSAELADEVMYRCVALGLSFKLGGGNVITLCPPLTITQTELETAFRILETALAETAG
jgi:4-aminobutyrate aminotransferase